MNPVGHHPSRADHIILALHRGLIEVLSLLEFGMHGNITLLKLRIIEQRCNWVLPLINEQARQYYPQN